MMELEGWHFLREDRRLAHEPHTLVETGRTLRVKPPIALCERGLHASRRALDALGYAHGPVACRVVLSGTIIEGDGLVVATERTALWMADATETLWAFARRCALSVAHRWDMPQVVRRYLETGDETLRDAAGAAARPAAWAIGSPAGATRAAGAAVWAAGAAGSVWATRAAGAAVWAAGAALAAAGATQNEQLERMLFELAPPRPASQRF